MADRPLSQHPSSLSPETVTDATMTTRLRQSDGRVSKDGLMRAPGTGQATRMSKDYRAKVDRRLNVDA